MAGRGRGRGRGATLSFNLESLGVQRSELYSTPIIQPLPLYSHVSTMPIPDTNYSADDVKLVEMALRVKARWRKRAGLMTLEDKKRDIARYSDKYQLHQQKGLDFTPDWSQFPEELRPHVGRGRKKLVGVRPNLKAARTSTSLDTKDVLAKVKERLATQPDEETSSTKDDSEPPPSEKVNDAEKDEEEEEEEGGVEQEEEEEDFDDEEETDYNLTYFDNGESFGDEDVEDDEPTYNFG